MRIELKNPTSRGEVKLGTARIGQIIRKTVPIVNRSSAEAKFTLSITPGQNALQESGVLGVYPSNQITLAPKESRDIEVVFAPKRRVAPFREDVILESFGSSKPFLSLIGACHAIQVSLDQDLLEPLFINRLANEELSYQILEILESNSNGMPTS